MNVLERIKELHHKLVALPDAEQPADHGPFGVTYKRLVSGKTTEESVEGALSFDTHVAARLLRRYAAKEGDAQIAALKLGYIHDVLAEVTNREEIIAEEDARMDREEAFGPTPPLDPELVRLHEQLGSPKRPKLN